jgi:hypothetical protein
MAESQEAFLPPLCGAGWGDAEPRTMRARVGYLKRPELPADAVPDAVLHQAVVVYDSTERARAWVAGFRAAVEGCPEGTVGRRAARYEVLTGVPGVSDLGDETLVVHQQVGVTSDVGGPAPGFDDFWTVSVRHGDTVTTVRTSSYENWGLDDPSRFYELVAIAAERVADWRGVVAS